MTGRRRTKYALMTAALLASVTGVCGLAVALGDTFHTRLDATATRAHSLDERTRRLLGQLEGEHELVISADLSRLSRAAQGALGDLLDALENAPNMRVTVVDSREKLAELIARLAERDSERVERHVSAIETARVRIGEAIEAARSLAERLEAFETRDPSTRSRLEAAAASIGSAVRDLEPVGDGLQALKARPYPGGALPEADAARDAIDGPGARLITALNTIERELAATRRASGETGDDATAAWARGAQEIGERVRAAMRRADDALRGVEPLEPVRLARAIELQELILLIGPERTTALDVRTLVPREGASGADAVRLVREGEAALATALASAAVEHPPIVVLVHGATQRLLDRNGRPIEQLGPAFGGLHDRLARRRIDLAEWAVATGMPRPDRAALDPSGERPIVWMTTGIPSPGTRDRYQRLINMAAALSRLANAGESLLLTIPPSDAESLGTNDQIAAVAEPFGLSVRTATPVITRVEGGFVPYQDVRRVEEASPLAPSVSGLPTLLTMPPPIALLDPLPAGVNAEPLLTVTGGDETWGEARWFELIYAPQGQRPTPEPDPEHDAVEGPYLVAATASRARTAGEPSPTITGAQRIVVVSGSDEWYATNVLTSEVAVDGGRSLQFPGNAALLDASISYLAGLDQLLSRESRTADVPRIGPLSERQLLAMRVALIGGLPLGVLVVGGVWRLVRG